MVPIAWRMICKEKTKFFITVCGVGLTVMLMLILTGIYQGVRHGSICYVEGLPAEIWVCQRNSTNLLRSSSFLKASDEITLREFKGIGDIAKILRVIGTAQIRNRNVTMFVFGVDTNTSMTSPASIIQGSAAVKKGGIILDRAFAAKHRLRLDDSILIQGRHFRVSGISANTNALVAQFSFTTLEDAQQLIGIKNIVSFFLLRTDGSMSEGQLIDSLKKHAPEFAVFSKHEFIANNLIEMETGVLPVLWTISMFGILVGTVVITLMLYGSVLEKREEYALLKAVGADQGFITSLILKQSLLGSLIGCIFGFLLNMICTPILIWLVPEITLSFVWQNAGITLGASILMGVVGSLVPLFKLARIYPAEVFRA